MEKERILKGSCFYGNEVSDYGKKYGYVDYKTLAQAFDAVLCNDIVKLFFANVGDEYNEAEQVNGFSDDDPEVFQYFIISSWGAEILQAWTDEIVYYLPALDIYIWGVTHWGTSWDYVLTNIKMERE